MNIRTKIFLFAIQLQWIHSDFITNPLNQLFPSSSIPINVTITNTQISAYSITSPFTANIKKSIFNGANFSLNLNFNIAVIISNLSNKSSFSITFSTSSQSITTITFSISNNLQTDYTISNCIPTFTALNPGSNPQNCISLLNEQYQLIISGAPVQTNSLQTGTSQQDLSSFGLLKIFIGFIYFPSKISNANAVFNVDFLNTTISYSGSNGNYISFYNEQLLINQCPQNCLICDINLICTSCLTGFTLNSGSCICTGTLNSYMIADFNPATSYTSTIGRYYYSSATCLSSAQITPSILNEQSCLSALRSLLNPNEVIISPSPGLNPNQITMVINLADTNILSSVPTTCSSKAYILNTLQIGSQLTTNSLFQSTTSESGLVFNNQYAVQFGTLQNCNTTIIPGFLLQTTSCNLFTTFVFRNPYFNSTITTFQHNFMKLASSTANRQLFLPVFQTNPNITVKYIGQLSILFCFDLTCLFPVSTNVIFQEQFLVLKVVFLDPIFNFYQPDVYANLIINGELHNTLIVNSTLQKSAMYNHYLVVLTFSSPEISSPANVTMSFSFGLTTPQVYNTTVSAIFQVIISNAQSSNSTVPFSKSWTFFNVVLIAIIFGMSLVFGLLAFLITKVIRRETDFEDDYDEVQVQNHNGRHFGENISFDSEEYGGRVEKNNNRDVPYTDTKAEDIYSKLINR